MRELKFRAWDKQLKHFKYFDLSTSLPSFADKSNFIIQQFTELLDSKSREIYEGDVLRFEYSQEDISYLKKRGSFKTHEDFVATFRNGVFEADSIRDSEDGIALYECNNLIIIGNIFENSNLLK